MLIPFPTILATLGVLVIAAGILAALSKRGSTTTPTITFADDFDAPIDLDDLSSVAPLSTPLLVAPSVCSPEGSPTSQQQQKKKKKKPFQLPAFRFPGLTARQAAPSSAVPAPRPAALVALLARFPHPPRPTSSKPLSTPSVTPPDASPSVPPESPVESIAVIVPANPPAPAVTETPPPPIPAISAHPSPAIDDSDSSSLAFLDALYRSVPDSASTPDAPAMTAVEPPASPPTLQPTSPDRHPDDFFSGTLSDDFPPDFDSSPPPAVDYTHPDPLPDPEPPPPSSPAPFFPIFAQDDSAQAAPLDHPLPTTLPPSEIPPLAADTVSAPPRNDDDPDEDIDPEEDRLRKHERIDAIIHGHIEDDDYVDPNEDPNTERISGILNDPNRRRELEERVQRELKLKPTPVSSAATAIAPDFDHEPLLVTDHITTQREVHFSPPSNATAPQTWDTEITGASSPLPLDRRRALLEWYAHLDTPAAHDILRRIAREDPDLAELATSHLAS